MGEKGDSMTGASAASAEALQRGLAPLGDIRLRKMFGGHGVFAEDKMFALVDSQGGVYFKVDDTNRDSFEAAGAPKHGRMPYYRVPDAVLSDEPALREWARAAIAVAQAAA